MSEYDKLHSGELYLPGDESIMREQLACLDRLRRFNALMPSQIEERFAMMREMFAEVGEDTYIESPFYANFGGKHVHLGQGVYLNFGVTIVDDTHVYIGDKTLIGPGVTIATACHPLDNEKRAQAYQYNKSVRIGRNCWLGAGAIILPGVTIGDNTVVGAGSVVTKDLPSGVVAVGNPCRIIKETC